jgi:hypothetical protein
MAVAKHQRTMPELTCLATQPSAGGTTPSPRLAPAPRGPVSLEGDATCLDEEATSCEVSYAPVDVTRLRRPQRAGWAS